MHSNQIHFFVAVLAKAKPLAAQAWKYGKVELKPPGPSEWGKAAAEAGQFVQSITTGRFLQQTTKVFGEILDK